MGYTLLDLGGGSGVPESGGEEANGDGERSYDLGACDGRAMGKAERNVVYDAHAQQQGNNKNGQFKEGCSQVGEHFAHMPSAKEVGKSEIEEAQESCDDQCQRKNVVCQRMPPRGCLSATV